VARSPAAAGRGAAFTIRLPLQRHQPTPALGGAPSEVA
jgi:hypothetical protein